MGECSKKGLGGRILAKGTIPEKVSELENDAKFLNPEALAQIILAGLDDKRVGCRLLVQLTEGLTEAQKKKIRENLGIEPCNCDGSGTTKPPEPDNPGESDGDGDKDPDGTGGDKFEEIDPDEIEW